MCHILAALARLVLFKSDEMKVHSSTLESDSTARTEPFNLWNTQDIAKHADLPVFVTQLLEKFNTISKGINTSGEEPDAMTVFSFCLSAVGSNYNKCMNDLVTKSSEIALAREAPFIGRDHHTLTGMDPIYLQGTDFVGTGFYGAIENDHLGHDLNSQQDIFSETGWGMMMEDPLINPFYF